jgi:hypothetical protein
LIFAYENKITYFYLETCNIICCIISSDHTNNLPKKFLFATSFGQLPNISHFHIFYCVVYVPIAPPQHIKMGPQHRLEIYADFDSSSIITYLDLLTSDIFKACFEACHFDKSIFLSLGKEKSLPKTR